MQKQLFESKIKDGIFFLGVLALVGVTSLSLDNVKWAFRKGKIQVTCFVPSYDVPTDGPLLNPGDSVKLYKQNVGRVMSVDFYVAKVKKLADGVAPTAPTTGAPPPPPITHTKISYGLKMRVELYKGDYPQMLTMITPESNVRVESQTLGESSLQLRVSELGDPVKDGDLINFPRNDPRTADPKDPRTLLGVELTSPAEVEAARKAAAADSAAAGAAAAAAAPPRSEKKAPSEDDF